MPNASLTIDGTEVITKENGVVSLKNTNADTSLSFPANHAGIKTALKASGDAPIYACRAWVNFNGTGTVAIGDSGNVSSITDNGTGDYTVNFTTAMPNANYAVTQIYKPDSTSSGALTRMLFLNSQSAGSFNVVTRAMGGTPADYPILCFAVFS